MMFLNLNNMNFNVYLTNFLPYIEECVQDFFRGVSIFCMDGKFKRVSWVCGGTVWRILRNKDICQTITKSHPSRNKTKQR